MIDRGHALPLCKQTKALRFSRGSIYYRPRPVSEARLGLMRRIDELHLERPFAGSRMMRDMLRMEGALCGRRHVATLMRRMGIEALNDDNYFCRLTTTRLAVALTHQK